MQVLRSCELKQTFCDLGMSPLANSYLTAEQLNQPEIFYPLHAYVCSNCLLVQLAEFESPEAIFGDTATSPRTPKSGWTTPAITCPALSSASRWMRRIR